MINFLQADEFKEKFAKLLSKLYYSGSLSLDYINNVITFSDKFSFLEENKIDEFMGKTYSELAKNMFNVELIFDSSDINPIYWAGIQYINILIQKEIPLKQIFLLCPLNEMINLYETFHEENEEKLAQYFINNYYSLPILPKLRKQAGLSVRKLSLLTDISIFTLNNYEKSNEALFNASFINVNKLKTALNLDDYSFFKIKTDFFFTSRNILKDEVFVEDFKEVLEEYLNINIKKDIPILNKDIGKKCEDAIYIGTSNFVKSNNLVKALSDNEMKILLSNTLNNFK